MQYFNTSEYLKPHWFSIVVALICSVIVALIASCMAVLIGPSIQLLMNITQSSQIEFKNLFGNNIAFLLSLITSKNSISSQDLILWLPVFIIIFAFLKSFFSALQWFLWERLTEIAAKKIRQTIVDLYLRINPVSRQQSHENFGEEDLSSILANDVRIFKDYIVHFYGGIFREGLQVLFLMFTLLLLSPHLFVIFFVGIMPLALIVRRLGIMLKSRFTRALEQYSLLMEWLQQRFLGIETIKHHRSEQLEIEKMQKLNDTVFKLYFKTSKVKVLLSPLLELISVILIAGVLLLALYLISIGKTSGSVQLSFFSTLVLLSQSASKLGKYFNLNREGASCKARLNKALKWLTDNQKLCLKPYRVFNALYIVPSIDCQNIYVRYKGREDFALKNFTYIFDKPKIYCICGQSGSGKSTLLNLILGLIEPEQGMINIRSSISDDCLIGYVPQNLVLSYDTIAENIAYPQQECDVIKVAQAIKEVHLEHKIQSLKDKINTKIGEDGVSIFSGGEKQRIFLARLIYHDFNIILFDEGTSALDVEQESIILQFLKNTVKKHHTVVVMIAHRLSALSIADEILLLHKGELIASGSPEIIKNDINFQNFCGLNKSLSNI